MSLVYYIWCPGTELVKIGVTGNLAARFSQLQSSTAHGLQVLATEPGGRQVEVRRHAQFASSRVCREWFSPTDDLMKHIAGCEKPVDFRSRQPKAICGLSDDRIAQTMKCNRSYATQMRLGTKPIPLEFAVRLYAETGTKIGPIVTASSDDLDVLCKFLLAPAHFENRAA